MGWGGYQNGKIPLSELNSVSGHYFKSDAAAAMVALRSAYQSALGRSLPINDGYRDLANQWVAWNNYQNGGNLAAYPGTSNHGWALAVDFGGEVYSSSTSQGHRWLQSNAATYGWWWAGKHFTQVENWHWEFNGTFTGGPGPVLQEANMEAIVKVPSGVIVHLRQGGKTDFGSQQQYNDFRMQVNTLRSLGATDILPLPELSTVPGVTWDTFTFLAQYIGAPTA